MFYAHFVLAKKGPLARIWLAAHWDKKLTKAHVYETNIEHSVDGIMQPKVKMALRTSGHLLLGVVRIYSRKAKYLLADCNEAFVKIKMAFRPGMVDLPEDKREAAMNAITLPDVFHDFEAEMPELDDMDIQQQFVMNQSRVEEITMREDYGNITLSHEDDGFGDSMELEAPEMLRDVSHVHQQFATELSLETDVSKARDQSREISLHGDLSAPGTSGTQQTLDAPIGDDGFGGVGLVNDILSGGLFEEGTLFGQTLEAAPSPLPVPSPVPEPMSGPPSPVPSDMSRPPTPLEDEEVPVPEVPAPQLDQTPVVAEDTPARLNPSETATASQVQTVEAAAEQHDQTTLLQNEEESFALAPVEASVLKGERRKRKRKLIVDDIKAITGEGMKVQLSDSADIVTTLDIAPPTKRLMHWKETGGVDELFNLPSRKFGALFMTKNYKDCLKMKGTADESILVARRGDALQLELIGVERDFESVKGTKPRAPKRKRMDTESAYAKRQQELLRQQEEFRHEQEQARLSVSAPEPEPEKRLQEDSTFSASLQLPEPATAMSGLFGESLDLPPPPSPAAELSAAAPPSAGESWQQQDDMFEAPPPEPMSPGGSDYGEPDLPDLPEQDDEGEQEPLPEFVEAEEEDEEAEMWDDETIEQYEDRVLNKRAAQMHAVLAKKFSDEKSVPFNSLLKKNNRKQASQKFYSILVLQKFMAVDAKQSKDSFGPITLMRGNKFDSAIKLL